MRFVRHAAAAAVAAVVGFGAAGPGPANAGETMTITAEKARFYFGGLYPFYSLYLKGIPDDLEAGWVETPHYAVLDVHGGPEEGQSAILILTTTSAASPQPEWCVTEGAGEFGGHGPTCINTDDPRSMNQLRFKVRAQYADAASELPAEFQDRVWAEYPELPGRRESEVFGPVDLHIFTD